MAKEFNFKGIGNYLLEFTVGEEKHQTNIATTKKMFFFSEKIFKKLRDSQILVFHYGTKNLDGKHRSYFELRKDLDHGHLNFDWRFDGKLMNNFKTVGTNIKKTKDFFLHVIDSIPDKIKIDISYFESGGTPKDYKKIKTYKINL